MPKPLVIFSEDRSRALSGVGEKITVLASREDTHGYEMLATPGPLVHVPDGSDHWFKFDSDGAQMLSVIGSGSRAAAFFTQLDAAVSDGDDLAGLGIVTAKRGLTITALGEAHE